MKYLSVCSGIEAASVAWHPLGWEPFAFAEIEKFPSAVLAHHYPSVPNFGDMTKFKDWPDATIDVLVGGTPCQSFSVAGLRKGLADPRGNLALTYLAIADKYRPEWLVWENVPGVLSSDGGRDFGAFLGGLGQLGYGWSYRVLDAQYVRVDGFGRAVPQRRRRVFVVGHLGDWRRAAAVLFERESLQGNTAPRRQTGKGASVAVAPCLRAGGNETGGDRPYGTDVDTCDSLIAASVAPTLNAHFGDKQGLEDQHVNGGMGLFIAHPLRGNSFDAGEDGTGRGTPLVPIAFNGRMDPISGPVPGAIDTDPLTTCVAIQERAVSENPDAGPDGMGVRDDGAAYTLEARTVPQAVAYSAMPMNSGKDFVVRETDVAQPLMAAGPGMGAQGGDYIAFAQNQRDEVRLMDVAGALASEPGMKQQTYVATHETAGTMKACKDSGGFSNSADYAAAGYMALNPQTWAVRRLTPKECERLQGFPDGYTLVPHRGKPAADGPRYKALGNSMAVNCMRWIGHRIELVRRLP